VAVRGQVRPKTAVLAPGIPLRRSRGRGRSPLWPIAAMFVGLPLWWAMGVSGFIVPVMAFLMLLVLLDQETLEAPRGFGVWLLFLLWVLVTATQMVGLRDWFAFAYRLAFYVSAAVIFLYVLNAPRDLLPSRRVVNVMALFFGLIVVGGILGVILPGFSFRTPMEALLPGRLLAIEFVSDMVEASTTTGRAFAAYPIYRPKAPFIYTNQWGATFALVLPLAIAALQTIESRTWRRVHLVLLVVSIVPLVFSLGRGGWLSVAAGLTWAGLLVAWDRDMRKVRILLVGAAMVAALLMLTPLGDIILVRLEHGYSDQGRLRLYTESLRLVGESPVLGHAAPVSVPGRASIGTHGQFWTVIVSHGVPGVILFSGWLLWALWCSGRRIPVSPEARNIRFWCHIAIFTAIVQMPYYELIPWGLPIVMVAAALAWREGRSSPVTVDTRTNVRWSGG
jgi:hypothetical protein